MMVHAYDIAAHPEVDAGGSEVQGNPWLQGGRPALAT